jgi:hypothetical protein
MTAKNGLPAAGPDVPEAERRSIVDLRCSDIEATVYETLNWPR